MEVDAGDGTVPQGKKLPAEGLEAYVFQHVPHTDVLEGERDAAGGPWGDSGYLRPWGMRGACSSWCKHFLHHLLHRRQWYHRDAILCSDEETEAHPTHHDPEPSPRASTLLERLPLSDEDED